MRGLVDPIYISGTRAPIRGESEGLHRYVGIDCAMNDACAQSAILMVSRSFFCSV